MMDVSTAILTSDIWHLTSDKKVEASDPRNRLPPSQLGSPYLQGGQVRARSIFPRLRFGNSCLLRSGPGVSPVNLAAKGALSL